MWLVKKGEKTRRACLVWAILFLGTSSHVRAYHYACRSLDLGLCTVIHFCHEMLRPLFRRYAPFPLVLGCSRPLVGVDAESSEVVQEIPHPHFSSPPTQSAPPPNIPNITPFGSLVSSMRTTNPANTIRLLRKVALDALTSRLDKRVQIGNRVVGAIVLSPTDAASQEPLAGSAQRFVVSRARASRDAAVQHYLEYLVS